MEFLAEELDALRFLDLDIFTEEEKAYILQSRPTSRAECTKLMLGYICQKNDNDIEKFIHEIKQKKRFVWDQISTQGKINITTLITHLHASLVDFMQPYISV